MLRCLWGQVQFTSLLAALLTSLLCSCANRGIIFYLPLKEASAAEPASEHSSTPSHRTASEFQSTTWTTRWRWETPSTGRDIHKVLIHPAAVSAESVPWVFTTILIHATALLSQVGLWDAQLRTLTSRFCWTNLQTPSVHFPLSLCLTSFAHKGQYL